MNKVWCLLVGCVTVCLPFAASADVARVLPLCLDTSLRPEDRGKALQAEGWQTKGDPVEALATALTLTRLSAGKPEEWAAIRDTARSQAVAASGSTFLTSQDGRDAVFFGRDVSGLQTCLYLGGSLDMAPLAKALDGSILRTIGEVSRIRGDGVKSLITAHGMTEVGRDGFDPPLAYAMTFTVVLDRQPGDR